MAETWTEILDAQLLAGKFISSALMTALRDRPEGLAAGVDGAPRISPAALGIGGSGYEGAAIALPTTRGIYHYTTLADSAGATLAEFTRIHCRGNVSLPTGTITVSAKAKSPTGNLEALLEMMPNYVSRVGGVGTGTTGGGGGGAGVGGEGKTGGGSTGAAGGAPLDWNALEKAWGFALPMFGGAGGASVQGAVGGNGGGCFMLFSDGDIDLSNATIAANGDTGGIVSNSGGGGGGGGLIFIACAGTMTLTGATLNAQGGGGGNNTQDGGGGGGGVIVLLASAYIGTPTTSVIKGTLGSGGTAGFVIQETLTQLAISGMLQNHGAR